MGNLSFKTNEQELESTFFHIWSNCLKLRGFAFITLEALNMDGKELSGRNIRVNMATEKKEGRRGR